MSNFSLDEIPTCGLLELDWYNMPLSNQGHGFDSQGTHILEKFHPKMKSIP